jgi:hypothetical protein
MNNKEITEVDIIPYETIIDIPISGRFYERMQNCLFTLINEKDEDPEVVVCILKELETRPPQNTWEEHLMVLLAVVYAVDNQAAEKGLTIKEKLSKFMPSKDSSQEASPES